MEQLDQALQRRVWSRVQSRESAAAPNSVQPEEAYGLVWENLGAYAALRQQLSGKPGEAVRKLFERQQQTAACLRGMYRLQGRDVRFSPSPASDRSAARLLEGCFYREQRLERAFSSRREDARFGPVYAALADRAKENCCRLLELLGR